MINTTRLGITFIIYRRLHNNYLYWGAMTSCSQYRATVRLQYVRGTSKRFVDWHSHNISTSYFATFNIDSCHWNALGPAFLQSWDSVVDVLFAFALTASRLTSHENANKQRHNTNEINRKSRKCCNYGKRKTKPEWFTAYIKCSPKFSHRYRRPNCRIFSIIVGGCIEGKSRLL